MECFLNKLPISKEQALCLISPHRIILDLNQEGNTLKHICSKGNLEMRAVCEFSLLEFLLQS